MKEFPTYTPDFEEYIRMKAAGTDGFPYERHYGYDHSVAMSFEEHVRRQTTYTPASTPANVIEKVTNVTENVIEKLTDRQRQIVNMVAKYPFTTTTLMAQNLKVSLMTIRRDIEKMSHVIRHVGPDKGGHWEIIKE